MDRDELARFNEAYNRWVSDNSRGDDSSDNEFDEDDLYDDADLYNDLYDSQDYDIWKGKVRGSKLTTKGDLKGVDLKGLHVKRVR